MLFPHEQWLHDGYMYAEQSCVKLRLYALVTQKIGKNLKGDGCMVRTDWGEWQGIGIQQPYIHPYTLTCDISI